MTSIKVKPSFVRECALSDSFSMLNKARHDILHKYVEFSESGVF